MYRPLDHPLLHRLREQVLYSAGPIGSTLLSFNLGPEAYVSADGEAHDGCPEWLNVSNPAVLEKIYTSFYEVGVDAVDSCSFGANPVVLAEFDLADRTRELNRLAAEVIGRVRDRFSTPEHPRYAFGTMGPGTKLPSLGHITWDELVAGSREQAIGLIEGGIDVLKVETCQDLLQTKAYLAGCEAAFEATGKRIPVIASVTIETTGTMLLGSDIACALTTLEPLDIVDIIGINCATGPDQMIEHARYLAEHSRRPVFIGPNAGLPEVIDGQACYTLTPEQFAKHQHTFVNEFGTNVVAGCCGTTPAMFKAAIDSIGRRAPEFRPSRSQFLRGERGEYEANVSSIYQSVPIEQDISFLVIGERTNATGSRAFRDLLLADDLDGIVALAREQAAEGAHVIDVMVDYVGRDGVADMDRVASALRTQSTLPLVFDSTEPPVIETGLKLYAGKAIVNSINLEDGERKIRRVLPLIRRHGAAAIALTIDEEGQARTTEWKLRVARRIYDLAVTEYGMEPGDLLFDFLTFPLSGGQEDLRKDAMETFNAIKQMKAEYPGVHTTLGVSNCSFGLKPAARRVLNSVFLFEAVDHGLDSAIVNAKQIVPLNRIPEEQLKTARDLIYDRRSEGYDPLTHFISLFENVSEAKEDKADRSKLPVEQRLQQRIIDGDRRGLDDDLEEALGHFDALTIINEHLLDGMRVVGELFGAGKMQLPFVLQSAETMKQSVAYLEPYMEKAAGSTKGKVVLATVRGDVHDIGKNLVDIILSNNGYTTYNIGIKQPIQNIIEKAQEVGADAIGLSGLLVKSTVVMREDLEELNSRELFHYPVILGGAALTRRYVEEDLRRLYKGTVYYAQDAFEGLSTLDKVVPAAREGRPLPVLTRGGAEVTNTAYDPVQVTVPGTAASNLDDYARTEIAREVPIPAAPFWGSRIVRGIPLRDIYPWINETQLFRGQWQYHRNDRSEAEYDAFVDEEVRPVFRRWAERAISDQLLTPQVVYGYFPCLADKNELICWPDLKDGKPSGEPVRLKYPRQSTGARKCIADFFRSLEEAAAGGPQYDVVAMTLVTMGSRASAFAQELFEKNEYRDYLHWHGFSVESAEALAEMWHRRVREELGIAGNDSPNMRELFQAHYQGARYSFGYPACPDLEEQANMKTLLQPERIGVELSETFMWHPEQTTAAVVAHHPEARYFVVK
jgi:5-methyltetrahydrofolate--homocysteine methyltransferase